jgi:hypothetical protein
VRWIDGHSTDWIDDAGRLLKDWKHGSNTSVPCAEALIAAIISGDD